MIHSIHSTYIFDIVYERIINSLPVALRDFTSLDSFKRIQILLKVIRLDF